MKLTRKKAREILRTAFKSLTYTQLKRFKIHLLRKTPITGDNFIAASQPDDLPDLPKNDSRWEYRVCPATMACTTENPKKLCYKHLKPAKTWEHVYDKMMTVTRLRFQDALDVVTEGDIRSSMWAVIQHRKLGKVNV